MNITVYLGANEGNDPSIAEAARELGFQVIVIAIQVIDDAGRAVKPTMKGPRRDPAIP